MDINNGEDLAETSYYLDCLLSRVDLGAFEGTSFIFCSQIMYARR
jgi:hypothetical protein